MASLITLCNQALALIGAGSVASLNESSIESRECNRFAQPLLNEMIDWSDSFGFGRTRGALASIANTRAAEWLHEYAAPADLGSPIAIRQVEDDAYDLPIGGPYQLPQQDALPLHFIHEGGSIFTNVENATLVYAKATIDAADLTPLGQRAFVDELAARLAVPVKKDGKMAESLYRKAEVSRRRWVADEENKTPRSQARYVSEVEYARAGLL